jgi:hypothetical protein
MAKRVWITFKQVQKYKIRLFKSNKSYFRYIEKKLD